MSGQRTIRRAGTLRGVAIHSGQTTELNILPAPPDHGIIFRRTDLPGSPALQLNPTQDLEAKRGTNIRHGNVEIMTVEHLLSALNGLGIDNIILELDGPELPIGDGSALPFVQLIENAGISEQTAAKREIRLTSLLTVERGSSRITATPHHCLSVDFLLNFPQTPVGRQAAAFSEDTDDYRVSLAPARTFGFRHEIEALWQAGLARGGSLENAIIVEKDGYSTPLRFDNELARHKIIDLIGDLMLLGQPIKAHFICIQSGHQLDIELVKKIWEDNNVRH